MTNNFHDIIPPERRSIRNITTPHRHPRRSARRSAEEIESGSPPIQPPPTEQQQSGWFSSFFSRFGLWVIAGITVIVFVLAFSLFFSDTTVTITPKHRAVFIEGQFESFRTAEVGQLAHEVVSIEKSAEKTIPAVGEQEIEKRASGQIIIFNNFGSAEQRLITNTRFEAPDGLIYRIDGPIVVPGRESADGEVVPGSIEVTVYADEPGERYNIGLTDFTIPGFKGSPRFEGFFARSKTPMTSGFVGTRRTALPEDIERTQSELREELDMQIRSQAQAEVPDGFFLFDELAFTSFETLPQGEQGSDSVVIREKATLYGLVYRKDDLARFVAIHTIAGYEQEPILIENPEMLSLSLSEEFLRPWEEEEISILLRGDAEIVWVYDELALKNDLAGRAKDALPTILSGYPSIEEAQVSLRPFWRQTFPDSVERITIQQNRE